MRRSAPAQAKAAGVEDDDAGHEDDGICFYLLGDDVELLDSLARAVLARHDLLAVATLGLADSDPADRNDWNGGGLESSPPSPPVREPVLERGHAWSDVWVRDDRAPHIPRSHLLVAVEYMSSRYSPHVGGEELFNREETDADDAERADPLLSSRRGLFNDPAWQTWLDHHMRREDVELSLRIDEVPGPKVTHGYSERDERHAFTGWIPVDDLVGDAADETAVFLTAHCRIYRAMAEEFDLPEPPPDL